MKKTVIVGVLTATIFAGLSQPALAGSSTDAALGLGAFVVFNQFLFGQTVLHPALGPQQVIPQPVIVHPAPTVIYAPTPPPGVYYAPPPAVVYAPPPVVYAPQPVIYPNGYVYGSPKHYRRHRHHDDDD